MNRASDVTSTDRWLNCWCIWHTKVETLQKFQRRHQIGLIIQDFQEKCVLPSLTFCLETKMRFNDSESTLSFKRQYVYTRCTFRFKTAGCFHSLRAVLHTEWKVIIKNPKFLSFLALHSKQGAFLTAHKRKSFFRSRLLALEPTDPKMYSIRDSKPIQPCCIPTFDLLFEGKIYNHRRFWS